MPPAIPPTSDTDKFPIDTAAVGLTWNGDDQNVWFVTAEGNVGVFEPRSPWSSTVFTRNTGLAGRSDSVVAWPGHGVWTFVVGQSDSGFVRCTPDGTYQMHTLNGRSDCRSLALAQGPGGETRIVAPLIDWGSLAFFESGSGISTSRVYEPGLYGIAVAEREPTSYWLSSPGGRSLVGYDAHTGVFASPVNIGTEPRDVAITPAGDVVWAATPDNVIFKYTVAEGRLTRIDTPYPAHRLVATADGTLWFAGASGDAIGYVLPGQSRAATIPTGPGSRPSGVAVSGDSQLWVALSGERALRRVSRHRLAVESGDGQTAVVGGRFAEPLTVKAMQLDGAPLAGQKIKFSVEGGSAVFENGKPSETRYTGTDGEQLGVATSSLLKTLKEGPCVVTARWTETDAVASFSRLVVTAKPGTADHVRYVSGAGQTVPAGKSFDDPMKVLVVDELGNPVEGAEVTFKIKGAEPATFPGGVDTATVPSEADGSATSPVLTAGDRTGGFSVRVWVADTAVSLLLQQNVS
ncbi:hypothetical protein [Saccharothrix sp. ST-888]|uniref:hypothetical protein n=1 Tax=Saccharothrix sp. ST-888 TaxID=1427391 RepID=UPI000697D105|nr:hypothetical protein [Saccharothrix sp. ST-888]